jgi:polysaccharide export outer membrane protein
MLALIFASGSVSAQIQAGKAINITISNVPDQDKNTINNVYPVSDSGMVNMPFIGAVRAQGLRNEELAAALQARYISAGIYTHPTIQVITNSVNKGVDEETVTLGGQIRKTGPVLFFKGLTIWQAIQNAGGPTEFGSMYRVTLFRDGNQKTYDLTKTEFMQIPLQRNDAIDIPQKNPWGR